MRTSDLSHTSIINYLELNGHCPVKIVHGSAWYNSPLREEKTPSFKVNVNRNIWFDFGTGDGGNIYSLVRRLGNFRIPEPLSITEIRKCTVKVQPFKPDDETGHIRIYYTRNLQNTSLRQYLKSRKIGTIYANKFVKEAYYTVHGKDYFAVAFENDLGGFELRNAFFKTGSSPKHFTTISGTDKSKVLVFEGFMDFLSCCTYYNKAPDCKSIILNSLSFLPKIEAELARTKTVNLFLDNDEAGRKATEKILAKFSHAKDWSQVVYPNHKDFNEFLMNYSIL